MKTTSFLLGILIGLVSCIDETSQVSDSPSENAILLARTRAYQLEDSLEDQKQMSTTATVSPWRMESLRRQPSPISQERNHTKKKRRRKMTTDNDKQNSTLGYAVHEIRVGILASADSKEYAEELAKDVRRMFPDRFDVCVLEDDDVEEWPIMQVLVLATKKANFPYKKAQKYIDTLRGVEPSSSVLVLTDLDLSRTLSDRRILYNVLSAGGLVSYLPRHAFANRDSFADFHDYKVSQLTDRRDQIEINGKILLKPVLERPVDPSDPEVRVYYPRSDGGGCKIIKFSDMADKNHTARFESSIAHIQKDSSLSFIYEELSNEPSVKIRQKERARDRLKGLVSKKNKTSTSFGDDDQISYESDLSRMDRKIAIVTTAAIPWMTGTAINPLLRAAHLKRGRPNGSVTLVIPWLDKHEDQVAVFGSDKFSNPEEQEVRVRAWLRDHANMPEEADPETGIKILWYPSRYVPALGSIFPVGDVCKLIPDEDADFCILEEPEHLNWIRGEGAAEIWTEKFKHVVGVIHTNYRAYASQTSAGLIAAPFVTGLSTLMVRAYCDKVIKLSATLQTYSPEKEVVSNVHGVRSDFLEEGKRRAEQTRNGVSPEVDDDGGPVAYFIGKLLWDKGLDHLLRLEYFYKAVTGEFFPIDIIGDGPDREDIEASFKAKTRIGKVAKTIRKLLSIDDDDAKFSADQLDVKKQANPLFDVPASMLLHADKIPGTFHGRKDHAHFCPKYRVLINPSTSEVLCTTVAEALAMGKFVIIPRHPSNEFFYQFKNCLVYDNKVEFVKHMIYALSNEPEPLSEEQAYLFTWEAATERLITASSITMKEGRARAKARKEGYDKRIAKTYSKLGARGDLLRMILDGGSSDAPTEAAALLSKVEDGDADSSSDE